MVELLFCHTGYNGHDIVSFFINKLINNGKKANYYFIFKKYRLSVKR